MSEKEEIEMLQTQVSDLATELEDLYSKKRKVDLVVLEQRFGMCGMERMAAHLLIAAQKEH